MKTLRAVNDKLTRESRYFTGKSSLGILCLLMVCIELAIVLPQATAATKTVKFQAIDLHHLVETGDYAQISSYLERAHDATINIAIDKDDDQGRTPLHIAALKGWTTIADLLITHHADINRQLHSALQGTPLICAVANNHLDTVQLLLDKGASINLATSSGITPLHVAAAQGRLEIIELLLRHHANANALAQSKYTPMDFALKTRQVAAAKLLAKYTTAASSH